MVFRPARVFGPYAKIYIIRPLQAIAAGNFEWLGTPDVPADMVYVDNVAEALIAALFAEESRVAGEAFNIGAGDSFTCGDFYAYFALRLGLDLSSTPVAPHRSAAGKSALRTALSFPADLARGVGRIITSPEFKSLGRRVLQADPIGTLPRKTLERFPVVERGVQARQGRRLIGRLSARLVCHGRPGEHGLRRVGPQH